MRVYLDVSCLNRPFDDQCQPRIRLEAEAVALVLERFDSADWQQVSSDMAKIEVDSIPDDSRKQRVKLLLPDASASVKLNSEIFNRAAALEQLGIKAADAVHLAAAEAAQADAFLTCDDRLLRAAQRQQDQITVQVVNPVDWLKEIGTDENAE